MTSTQKIYVLLSKTHTNFARLTRKFGKLNFNHAAIATDAELNQLYAFARPQHNAVFLARLVNESIDRYTLGKVDHVDVVLFELGVTLEQYQWVQNEIAQIQADDEYLYNLFSVLTYPLSKGFSTYKAFSCIEFVMYILRGINRQVTDPLHRYKPDDLVDLLGDCVCFKGNLLDYIGCQTGPRLDDRYFSPMTARILMDSAIAVKSLCARNIFRRQSVERMS